jgi:hypothetical protein
VPRLLKAHSVAQLLVNMEPSMTGLLKHAKTVSAIVKSVITIMNVLNVTPRLLLTYIMITNAFLAHLTNTLIQLLQHAKNVQLTQSYL